MPDPTSEFLEQLAERGRIPALQRTTGTLRVDVDRDGTTDQFRLDIRRGTVAVTRSGDDADCVIAATGALMDGLVTGRTNAMASTLRDELVLSGDPNLLVRFQRLFPNPTGRRKTAAGRTVGKRRG